MTKGADSTEPVGPRVIETDLRALERVPAWQPGDPIREVPRRAYGPEGDAPDSSVGGSGREEQGGGPPSGWVIENVHLEEPVDRGAPIEIRNPCGDVRVRGLKNPADLHVAVFAVVQRRPSDTPEVSVDIRRDHGPKVSVDCRGPAGPEEGLCQRVDLAVFVPRGSRIRVQSDDGLVDARGIDDDLEVETKGGDVTVSAAAITRVQSDAGNIRVLFQNTRWRGDAVFETTSGNVSVRLPKSAAVAVSASTGGRISTEYSIRVEREEHSRRKVATAQVGDVPGIGGAEEPNGSSRRILIRSVSGDIDLLGPFPEMLKP